MLNVQLAVGQLDSLNITITELPLGEESHENSVECEEAREKARVDMQSGFLSIERFMGLTFNKVDFEFEDFYTNYLIVNYKIDRVVTGCVKWFDENCYFDEMNKAIFKKHGLSNDELNNAAKTEYEQFKLLDNAERKRYIDFDYVYFWVDERATYETEIKYLQDKIRANVDFKKFNFSKFNLKGFYTEVVIDELGNVMNCKVVSANFPHDADQAIQKAVKEIGGWKAATLYGSKVKSRTGFSFTF